MLAWGPCNLDGWLVIAAGVFGAALGGWAWGWQARLAICGKNRSAKRFWNALLGFALTVLIIAGAVVLIMEIQFGQIPLPNDSPEQAFERLWKAMDHAYPYFDEKDVNWQQMYSEYFPLARLAPDSQSYFAIIASMLKELGDSHTMVEDPWFLPSCCFARTEQIEGQAVVTSLSAHAEQSGLLVGDILERVEGKLVTEVIGEMQFLRGASTPWQHAYWDFSRLLPIPDDGSLQITVRRADGSSTDIVLTYDPALTGTASLPPAVSFRYLPGNVGYIRIARFSNRAGENLVGDLDLALNELMDTRGLIIDLRSNGGGDSRLSDAVAGRLIAERFVYGEDHYRVPLPMHAFRTSLTMSISPREPVYQGGIVILIDTGTLSSSEWLLAALVDSGRAVTVGRQTGGGSGNPILFYMPGGVVKFSTGKFTRSNGQLIEGVGFVPDYPVAWRISDVLDGQDPDIEAAMVILAQ